VRLPGVAARAGWRRDGRVPEQRDGRQAAFGSASGGHSAARVGVAVGGVQAAVGGAQAAVGGAQAWQPVGGVAVELVAGSVSEVSEVPAGVSASGEELGWGGDGAGVGRRRVLAGGVALLAGGAGWWAVRRDRAPSSASPNGAGPQPLWVFREPGLSTVDGIRGTASLPVIASRTELVVLDPRSGQVRRRIPAPATPPPAGPGLLLDAGSAFTSVDGVIAVHGLLDPAADRRLAAPGGAPVVLDCRDQGVLLARSTPRASTTGRLFAVDETGALRWERAASENGGALSDLAPAAGGRLIARSSRDELVALSAADGWTLWVAPADQALEWHTSDAGHVYLATRGGGLRAVRLADGGPAWSLPPRPAAEDTRRLRPLAVNGDGDDSDGDADGTLFLPHDNGMVTCHATADGSVLWSCRLPFRLDHRCRPLLLGSTLYVPGPRAAGFAALDAATGAIRWTFRDPGPGAGFWGLATDGTRLFAGHDAVRYAFRPI